MKIGFYIRKNKFGGGENVQQLLVEEFLKIGHSVVLITTSSDLTMNNVEIIKMRTSTYPVIKSIYTYFSFGSLLKRYNIDCLIIFNFQDVITLSSFLYNIPSIISIRVDPRFQKNILKRKLQVYIASLFSSGIVFQTHKVMRLFPSFAIRNKYSIIPNPIMFDSHPLPIEHREKIIVSVCRLSEEKNLQLLINAFEAVQHKGYRLFIYGEGPLRVELEDLITKRQLNTTVFLMGHVEPIHKYISYAEIFVMTSNFEGMPNALIEAMSLGLACISTNFPSGGAEELISNNHNGILIPVNDVDKLVQSLDLLMSDNSKRLNIMRNAQNIKFILDRKKIINKWIDFISSIIAVRRNFTIN
jgi:glycosyltransferase involved in cell wall biosynthesis